MRIKKAKFGTRESESLLKRRGSELRDVVMSVGIHPVIIFK